MHISLPPLAIDRHIIHRTVMHLSTNGLGDLVLVEAVGGLHLLNLGDVASLGVRSRQTLLDNSLPGVVLGLALIDARWLELFYNKRISLKY